MNPETITREQAQERLFNREADKFRIDWIVKTLRFLSLKIFSLERLLEKQLQKPSSAAELYDEINRMHEYLNRYSIRIAGPHAPETFPECDLHWEDLRSRLKKSSETTAEHVFFSFYGVTNRVDLITKVMQLNKAVSEALRSQVSDKDLLFPRD